MIDPSFKKKSKFSFSSWLLGFTISYCVVLSMESKRRKQILSWYKITGLFVGEAGVGGGWASCVSYLGMYYMYLVVFILWQYDTGLWWLDPGHES